MLQPRLETGQMYYAFGSEAMNATDFPEPAPGRTGSNVTLTSFEYNGYLPFIGAGATLFANRFSLDFSAQYATGGHDTAPTTFSEYTGDTETFFEFDTNNTVRFNRSDAAISLGYAFTGRFSLFAGYKWAKTDFKTTFEGHYSSVAYTAADEKEYIAGRNWGEADYRFEYEGPFVGAIHSWDCSPCRILEGMFTVNLALAHLDGKVVLEKQDQHSTVASINGQPLPEVTGQPLGDVSARLNTEGDAWGLTVGVGWRGTTALEGFSYTLCISGYRYEFDAEDNSQSDINETSALLKIALAYVF